MIVFYTEKKALVSIANATAVCDKVCTSNCLSAKSKCCNKYKKKGINCKRCPNILLN